MMRPQSQILGDLIVQAEAIVTRPPVMLPIDVVTRLAKISNEIDEIDSKPAVGPRVTTWAMVLATALGEWIDAQRSRDKTDIALMCLMVAGATLPLVRRDVGIAISNEREQRAT